MKRTNHKVSVPHQEGFVLLGMMGLMTASLIMFFSGMSIIQMQQEQLDDYNFGVSASILMTNMRNYLNHDASWTKTIELAGQDGCNESLVCLRDQTPCPSSYHGNEVGLTCLFNSAGGLVLDLRPQRAGFNRNGSVCQDFVSNPESPPNPSCPFRYDLAWQPNCADPDNCVNPTYSVFANLNGRKPSNKPFNPGRYQVTVMR